MSSNPAPIRPAMAAPASPNATLPGVALILAPDF